ncbi:GNAT family N-acetyltransferase [Streptococcus ictaluri]|uniref:Acetyltransferase, GNAT domain protein n=1 Tax=Streptococcus ictaluri 707-05 TaxID=764299 RepID=G5JZC1_9STRE|nr:GNAT family N-acetyltransferase [Streptococcus ictaluri]EHI70752.1 acetyltransferase, GNAT domain protein [Streptococcus ictaluri 707-05]
MVTITFDKSQNRSVAHDMTTEIGECTFVAKGNVWTINHTFVDKAYGGQGIARQLVDKIADHARLEGIKLAATCPYVVNLFDKTSDFDDVLAD